MVGILHGDHLWAAMHSLAARAALIGLLSLRQIGAGPHVTAVTGNPTAIPIEALWQEPTDLERLDLSHNHVSDEGLRQLKGLKRLEVLEISNNATTDAGVDELRESLPDLQVLDD